jgi:hypothetical protein
MSRYRWRNWRAIFDIVDQERQNAVPPDGERRWPTRNVVRIGGYTQNTIGLNFEFCESTIPGHEG